MVSAEFPNFGASAVPIRQVSAAGMTVGRPAPAVAAIQAAYREDFVILGHLRDVFRSVSRCLSIQNLP
jgi:hypothetical protein